MTKQELLDRAYAHMVRQRSVAYDQTKKQCVYKAPDTKMCAIGGAVSPAVREELMASNTGAICDIFSPITEWGYIRTPAPLAVAELADCGTRFARDVQTELHDTFVGHVTIAIKDLDQNAGEIARRFGLLHPNRKRGVSHSDPKLVEAHAVEVASYTRRAADSWMSDPYIATCKAMAALPCTLFQGQLRRRSACEPARIWVGAKTAREAWETCQDAGWMDWLAWALGGKAASDLTWRCRTAGDCRAALPFEKLQELVAARTAALAVKS